MATLGVQEMKQACKYLCQQFGIEKKNVSMKHMSGHQWCICRLQERELMKFLKEHDTDGDGTLDFEEFRVAVKLAQERKRRQKHPDEVDVWSEEDS